MTAAQPSSSAPSRVAVVGGGILGLATARCLGQRLPDAAVVVFEKEDAPARHQTGRNSGVLHSGIYYAPGSLKARLCVRGAATMLAFCREHGIPHRVCGKVVVAIRDGERPRLAELFRRGSANGVRGLELIGPERLREAEPAVRGVQGLLVPGAAVVDFAAVARRLASGLTVCSGERVLGVQATASEVVVRTDRREEAFDYLVSCAGLQGDRVAALDGPPPAARIVPFRGDYWELAPERAHLVRGLIYPVPDPRFPFLGVHLTRRVDGRVEAGPTATLALAREGYRPGALNVRDLCSVLGFPGFWRLALRHPWTGAAEALRSRSRAALARAARHLVPDIRSGDLRRSGCGVRAQALDRRGRLVDDFLLVERPRVLHVVNAPSPAATAALAIAEEIAARACAGLGA